MYAIVLSLICFLIFRVAEISETPFAEFFGILDRKSCDSIECPLRFRRIDSRNLVQLGNEIISSGLVLIETLLRIQFCALYRSCSSNLSEKRRTESRLAESCQCLTDFFVLRDRHSDSDAALGVTL